MSFYDTLREVEDLANNQSPSETDVQRALNLFKSPVAEKYFFVRVNSINWIELLANESVFRRPPGMIHNEDRSLSFQYWMQSAALVRLAKANPSAIAKVASRIPKTKNPRVNDHLMDIAALLRSKRDVRYLLPHVLNYAGQQYHVSASAFSDVIERWTNIGAVGAAFRVARSILRFRRGRAPKLPKMTQAEKKYLHTSRREPAPRIPDWEFKQIIDRAVRKLADVEPEKTLHFLMAAIDEYLRISGRGSEDYSDLWCPSLDSGTGLHQAINSVVRATVICFENLVSNKTKFRAADALLRQRDGLIFNRIRWHVYTRFPKILRQAITKDIFEFVPQFKARLYPLEFAEMIKQSAQALGKNLVPARQRKRLWRLLSEVPIVEDDKRLVGRDLTEDERSSRRDYLLQARLTPFKSILPKSVSKHLKNIEKKLGPVNYRRFSMGEVKTIQSRSPLSSDDLTAKTNEELIDYLNTWQPPNEGMSDEWWIETNLEGLSKQFVNYVIDHPDRFRSWPAWWKELERPIFLAQFMESSVEVMQRKTSFDWSLWFEIAKWIADQPTQSSAFQEPSAEASRVAEWSRARNSVVRFLNAAISSEPSVPLSFSNSIVSLLANLSAGFDPSADRRTDSKGDPLQIGINTTRGAAIEAAVRYAYWLQKNSPAGSRPELTEFWKMIENRLTGDEVPSTYAVIGAIVPQLSDLDEKWVADHHDHLFPRQPTAIWNAAWNSFICYTNAYGKAFRAIRSVYEHAVDQLRPEAQPETSQRDPREALGVHLLNLYWAGDIELNDNLLARFYQRAGARVLGNVTREVGRVFGQATVVASNVQNRIMKLCDARLEFVSDEKNTEGQWEPEILALASWCELPGFPAEWRLDRLCRILQLVPRVDAHDFDLNCLLPELREHLPAVSRCLLLISEKLSQESYLSADRDAAKEILRAALTSPDPKIVETAIRSRDNLLLAGRFEFMHIAA